MSVSATVAAPSPVHFPPEMECYFPVHTVEGALQTLATDQLIVNIFLKLLQAHQTWLEENPELLNRWMERINSPTVAYQLFSSVKTNQTLRNIFESYLTNNPCSFIWFRYYYPPPRTIIQVTNRNFAHLLSDSFMKKWTDDKGNRLEGGAFHHAVLFVLAIMEEVKKERSFPDQYEPLYNLVVPLLKNAAQLSLGMLHTISRAIPKTDELNYSHGDLPHTKQQTYQLLEKIATDLQPTVKKIVKQIQALQEGQFFLVPIEYQNYPGGHVMLLEISRVPDQLFQMIVYNTGAGLEYHTSILEPNKKRFFPAVLYLGIEESALTHEVFWQTLFEPSFVRMILKTTTPYSAKDFYEAIFSRFADKRVDDLSTTKGFRTPQRSGSCSMRVIFAFLRLKLGESDYKKLKFHILFKAVRILFSDPEALKSDSTRRKILSNGIASLSRYALKSYLNFNSEFDLEGMTRFSQHVELFLGSLEREKSLPISSPSEVWRLANRKHEWSMKLFDLCYHIRQQQMTFQEEMGKGVCSQKPLGIPSAFTSFRHPPLPDEVSILSPPVFENYLRGIANLTLSINFEEEKIEKGLLNLKFVDLAILRLPFPSHLLDHTTLWSLVDPAPCLISVYQIFAKLIVERQDSSISFLAAEILVLEKLLALAHFLACRLDDSRDLTGIDHPVFLKDFKIKRHFLLGIVSSPAQSFLQPELEEVYDALTDYYEELNHGKKTLYLWRYERLHKYSFLDSSAESHYLTQFQSQIPSNVLTDLDQFANGVKGWPELITSKGFSPINQVLWAGHVEGCPLEFNPYFRLVPDHFRALVNMTLMMSYRQQSAQKYMTSNFLSYHGDHKDSLIALRFERVGKETEAKYIYSQIHKKPNHQQSPIPLNCFYVKDYSKIVSFFWSSDEYENLLKIYSENPLDNVEVLNSYYLAPDWYKLIKSGMTLCNFLVDTSVFPSLRLHRIKNIFESPLFDLTESDLQQICKLLLFSYGAVQEVVTHEPAFAEQFLRVLRFQIQRFRWLIEDRLLCSELSNDFLSWVKAYTYFSHLKIHFLEKLKSTPITQHSRTSERAINKKIAQERKRFLKFLNRLKRLERNLRNEFTMIYLSMFLVGPSPSDHELLDLFIRYASIIPFKDHLSSDFFERYDETSFHNMMTVIAMYTYRFAQLMDHQPEVRELFISRLLKKKHSINIATHAKWSGLFPYFHARVESDLYTLDLLEWRFLKNGLPIDDISEIYRFKSYQFLYGKTRLNTTNVVTFPNRYSPSSQGIYCSAVTPAGRSVSFSKLGEYFTISCLFDETRYEFVPWNAVPFDLPPLELQPNFLHYEVWASLEGDAHLRIIERKSKESICFISLDGTLRFPLQSGALLFHCLKLQEERVAHALLKMDLPYFILALKPISPSVSFHSSIQFQRYFTSQGERLQFLLKEPLPGQKLIQWVNNPGYFVDEDQSFKLSFLERYVVVKNSLGNRRLITPLTPYPSDNSDQVQEEYEIAMITIDLNERGEVAPSTQKERAFAAYLCLLDGEYHAAFSFLHDLYHHTGYTDDIFQILGWILHSYHERPDFHPNALAVRVYAGWLGIDNLFRNQPREDFGGGEVAPFDNLKASLQQWRSYWENRVPFSHAYLMPTLASLYLDYLGVRNGVDSLLQFDSEVGREETDPLSLKIKWAFFEEVFFLKSLMQYDLDDRIKVRYNALIFNQDLTLGPFLDKTKTFREVDFSVVNPGNKVISFVHSLKSLRNLYPRTRPEKVTDNFLQEEFYQILHLLLHAPETRREMRELLYDMSFDEPIAHHVAFLKQIAREGEEGERLRTLLNQYLGHQQTKGERWSAECREIRKEMEKILSSREQESFEYFHLTERNERKSFSMHFLNAYPPPPPTRIPLQLPLVEDCRSLPTYFITKTPRQSSSTLPSTIPTADPFILRKYADLRLELEEGKTKNDFVENFIFSGFILGETFHSETQSALTQIRARTLMLKAEIEEIAGRLPPADQKDLKVKIELERVGKKRSLPSLDDCLRAFIYHSTAEYHRINPFLTLDEIYKLHQTIGEFLFLSIEMERMKQQLEKNQNGDWQALGDLLEEKRAYDPHQYPSFLVFEYFMGFRLRSDQVADIQKMIPTHGVPSDCIIQKIMGAGKTLVLGTLLSFLKADGFHLSVMVPPSSLYYTNLLDIKHRAGKLFGQRTRTIALSRSSDHLDPSYLCYVRDSIFEAIRNKEVLVVPPDILHTIRNLYHLLHHDLLHSPHEMEMIAPSLQDLKTILNIFKSRGVFTFDEVHLVLETTKEYNFSVGESTTIEQDELSIVKWLYSTLAVDLQVPFEQYGSSAETILHYENVRSSLATLTVDFLLSSPYWRHLLKIDMSHREVLNRYFSTPFQPTPQFIHELYEQGHHRACDLLVFIFLEITLWIPASCKASIHSEYGFVNGKRNAVPCTANRRPSKEAEFRHSTEMMNRTFQLYLYTGLSKNEILRFVRLQKLKQRNEFEYELGKVPIEMVPAAKRFAQAFHLDLFSISESNKQALEVIRQKMRERNRFAIQYLLEFASDEVLTKVKIYKQQLHGNAHHLASLPKVRQGYSGSMECKERLPVEPHLDHGITGKILDITLSQNTKVHVVESFTVGGVLEEVLSKNHLEENPTLRRFRALIDSGPLFKGVDSLHAAKEILQFHLRYPERGVKAVLYWDDDTELLCCIKAGKESHPIILEKTDHETIFSTIELGVDDYFVYFPHHKLTGANIPLPEDARALATVSENTPLRDLFQGDFRMRNLKKQQRVERVVQASMVPLIKEKVKEDHLTITTVVLYTFFNQVEKEKNTLLWSVIQELEAVAEDYVDQLMLSSTSCAVEHEYFKRAHQLFVKKLEPSYYLQYGLDNSQQPIEIFLTKKIEELQAIIQQIRGDSSLEDAEMELARRWEAIKMKAIQNFGASTVDLALLNGASGRIAEQMQEQKGDVKISSSVLVDTRADSCECECKGHPTVAWSSLDFVFLDGQSDVIGFSQLDGPRFYRMNSLAGEQVKWAPDSVYASENFLFTEINKMNLFDQRGKHVHEVLACYSPSGVDSDSVNPWKIVLLSSYDVIFLKEGIKSHPKEMANMILVEPNLDIVQQGELKLGSLKRRDIKLLREALVPVLFFNGDIKTLTSKRWIRRLKCWLAEGKEEKRVLFENYVLRRSSVERRIYEGSLLQKLLA